MGCTPTKQDSTQVTETSQEDAQKIVERVYSAKQGAYMIKNLNSMCAF